MGHSVYTVYWLLLLLSLAACAAAPTYAEVYATAQVAGCWPGSLPTPRAVTVTPLGAPAASPPGVLTGNPTATVLPTTTPFPRCLAVPGATLAPWPTPVPPPPPYPTMEPRHWDGGSDALTVFHLPGTTDGLDLAVHPTMGWPVVGVLQHSWGTPVQAFVRVYDPDSRRWGVAQQLDIGAASSGTDRFYGIAVGVTGDSTVYAAWGASDRVLHADGTWATTPDLWLTTSSDKGAHWSAPQRIATNCWQVLDLATSVAGDVVVLAQCFTGSGAKLVGQATLLVRQPDGQWQPPTRLSVAANFGAVVIVGSGPSSRAVALVTQHEQAGDPAVFHVLNRNLATTEPWHIQALRWQTPGDIPSHGDLAWRVQGLAFAHPLPEHEQRITFAWQGRHAGRVYTITSPDAGRSWGAATLVAANGAGFVAPAYDPVADRLLALWTCCAEADDGTISSTHYAAWTAPQGSAWRAWPHPLALGARSAGRTITAQAAGSRTCWLAWVEQNQRVLVRSINLNTIIPVALYPTASPAGGP